MSDKPDSSCEMQICLGLQSAELDFHPSGVKYEEKELVRETDTRRHFKL